MSQQKVAKFANIATTPRSRNSLSSSSSSGYRSSSPGQTEWSLICDELMKLNERNFAKYSKTIVNNFHNIIQNSQSVSNSQAVAVLYILYERSVREVITKSFPISASLIDTLTTNCSESVIEIIQPLLQEHLKRLQMKLKSSAVLKGHDVGVLFLLLNMYKLDKMASRSSSAIIGVMDQLLEDVMNYIEFFNSKDRGCNDALVTMLFCLISYTLMSDNSNKNIEKVKMFVRQRLVKDNGTFSKLAKVLAADILEQCENRGSPIPLYVAIYKKIIASGKFILDNISDFLVETPFPDNVMLNLKIHAEEEDVNDEVFNADSAHSPGDTTPVRKDEVTKNEVTTPINKNRSEPDGQSDDDKLCNSLLNMSITSPNMSVTSPNMATTPPNMSSEKTNVERKPSWNRSLSQIQKQIGNKTTEVIQIPERYIGRVIGYEGAILRKLELQSNATITFKDDKPKMKSQEGRSAESLAAHRLIIGALGLSTKHLNNNNNNNNNDEKLNIEESDEKECQEKEYEELSLSGTDEQILKAKKLINEIITHIVSEKVYLDYSVDEIVDQYSTKLKTFETLLNVYLEIEEIDIHKVLITITGDEKSCKDCKKLVFEELGSFRSQHGHLFTIPSELIKCLKDNYGVNKLVKCVQRITGGRIIYMRAFQDYAIFISGYPVQVSRAMQIFQKTNIELLCSLSNLPSGKEITVDDLCEYIHEKFDNGKESLNSSFNQTSPSLIKKFISSPILEEKPATRLTYTRNELIELSQCEQATIFPKALTELLQSEPAMESLFRTNLLPIQRNVMMKDENVNQQLTTEEKIQDTKTSQHKISSINHQISGTLCKKTECLQVDIDEQKPISSIQEHLNVNQQKHSQTIQLNPQAETYTHNKPNVEVNQCNPEYSSTSTQCKPIPHSSTMQTNVVTASSYQLPSTPSNTLTTSKITTVSVVNNKPITTTSPKYQNFIKVMKSTTVPSSYPADLNTSSTIGTTKSFEQKPPINSYFTQSDSFFTTNPSSATNSNNNISKMVTSQNTFLTANQMNWGCTVPTMQLPLLPRQFTSADHFGNPVVFTPTLINIDGTPRISYQAIPLVQQYTTTKAVSYSSYWKR